MQGHYPVGRPISARGAPIRTQLNFVGAGFTSSTSIEVSSAQYFALSSFPNVAAYTGLFDQYRIVRAEMWFMPSANIGTSAIPETGSYCTAVDVDDVTAPATFNALIGKPNANISGMFAGHYHSFVPAIATAAYSGAFTSYASTEGSWLDCSSPSIQYYGVKTFSTVCLASVVVRLRIRVTVEFRGVSV